MKEECKQMGSLSGGKTFEDLTRDFEDLDSYIKAFNAETFEIEQLIEK